MQTPTPTGDHTSTAAVGNVAPLPPSSATVAACAAATDPPPPDDRLRIIESFFRLLYPTHPLDAHLSLWNKRTALSVHLSAADLKSVAIAALQISDAGDDCYFGIGLRRPGLPESRRGASNDVVLLPGFWIDLDLLSPVHAARNLPDGLEAGVKLIEEAYGHDAPSLVVHSGHGLHGYWLFRQPWTLRTPRDREDAARLSKAHQMRIIDVARAHGLHVDVTADIARVLRVPATRNYKVVP